MLDFCHNLCSAALESGATTFEAPEHVLPSDLFPLFPNNSIPAKVRMGWTFYVCGARYACSIALLSEG